MRRLLAAWLALVPIQPALAEIAPQPSSPALCGMHACKCRKPDASPRAAAPRSCHESNPGYMTAGCTHDPVSEAAPAGTAPYLAAVPVTLAAPAPRIAAGVPAATSPAVPAPYVDPPPPKTSAA